MELRFKTLKGVIPAVLLPPILLIIMALLKLPYGAFFSGCILLLALVPFFAGLEHSHPRPRDLVPIAVLSALAALGRALFTAAPNFKPVTAIVMIAGIQFGERAGFLTGALSALASNMLLGQGPWTPWQMYAWGMIGFFSGICEKKGLFRKRIFLYVFGFLSGILFGWFMNLQYLIGYVEQITLESVLLSYAASMPFDLMHGASAVIFLLVLEKPWGKKLRRLKVKYGILKEEG